MRTLLKRLLLSLVLAVVIVVGSASICYANSPPPPTVSIVVSHAPKDLELSIGGEKAGRLDRVFESYFTFYLEYTGTNYDKLLVTTSEGSFELSLPALQRYNNLFTLDLGKKTLTRGTSKFTPLWFAAITVTLTLLIEGLLFYLFGYRKRKSWYVFLVTNLVTQGILYVMVNGEFYPLVNSYPFPVIFSLVFGEFLVFVVEAAVFLSLVNEHSRWITFFYVMAANFASLVGGGLLIGSLI